MSPKPSAPAQRRSVLLLVLGLLAALVVAVAGPVAPARAADLTIERWRSGELSLTAARSYANPLVDVTVTATFTGPGGAVLTRPAFWDGGSTWKVRFAPTAVGRWTMTTSATTTSDTGLHGIVKAVDAVPYTGSLEIYRRGFLKKSADGHHLTYADGTPFFWLGDTHWILPHERFTTSDVAGVPSQFKYTVDKRAQQGFTVYQSEPIWTPHGTGDHSAPDEEAKADLTNGFTAADLPGFANLDRKFAYIADQGLVHANAEVTWSLDPSTFPSTFTDQYMAAVTRYWVARFGAYPAVWTIAQEIDKNMYGRYDGTTLSKWYAVGDTLQATDAYHHPVLPHQENTGSTTVADSTFAAKPWHTGFGVQIVEKGDWDKAVSKRYWDVSPAKPAPAYETSYEDLDGADYNTALSAAYKAFQLGHFGYGFGVNGTWNDLYSAPGQPIDAGTDYLLDRGAYSWWYDGANTPTGPRLTTMKAFYQSFEWWKQTPRFDDPAWGSVGGGGYLSSNGNDNYVVLFANGSTTSGTIRQLDDGAFYRAVWFDPRTGAHRTIGNSITSTAGAWTIPAKPGTADWVLRVTKTGQRAAVTGTPTATLLADDLNGSAQVRLTTATGGATIRYTTDGSDPTAAATAYSGPFTIAGTSSATVKAKAFSAGRADSAVMSETYPARRSLTAGGTFTASSQADADQTAARAFDGDPGTDWQACAGCFAGQWLEADWGTGKSVDQVTVSEYGNRTTGYRVEYWTGSAWATAYTGTGSFGDKGQTRAITFPAVTTSRLRLFFTSGTGTAPIVYEFGAFEAPVNLARAATLTASSSYNADQQAPKAADGNFDTDWQACADCAAPQWLQADFGTAKTFDQVTVSEYGSRTTSFRVEYWTGTTWQTAYTGTTAFGDFRTVWFPAVTSSKVRILYLGWTGTAPIVYEFGVHSTLSPTLTAGAAFSASSTYNADQTAAKAFDGTLATDWQAADGTYRDQWLQADFGTSRTFSTVTLSEYGARTAGFRVEYWTGTAWRTAFTGSTPIDDHREITFPAVTGSKVRLYFTSRSRLQPIIYEFGVHA